MFSIGAKRKFCIDFTKTKKIPTDTLYYKYKYRLLENKTAERQNFFAFTCRLLFQDSNLLFLNLYFS